MHDAYDLSQLLKLTVQIESIAAYDDYLLLGTKNGHLLTYSVTKKLGEHKHEVQLLSYNKHFSKKPIQQMQVVPEHQILISLSDNVISVLNLQKTQSQSAPTSAIVLQKTRGASLFSVGYLNITSTTDNVSKVLRMCVVVKRKLQIYGWINSEFMEMTPEITASDVPISAVLLEDAVCLGFKSEYSLLSVASKKFDALFPTGKQPAPIIAAVDKDVFALVKDSTQCNLVNNQGEINEKYTGKWSELPSTIICEAPYLIALLPEALEIRTIEPDQFIQSIPSAKGHLVVRARPGRLYVASSSYVWCLQAVPVLQQIKSFLENKQFELALKLARDWEWDDEEQQQKSVQGIQNMFAHDLFASKEFEKSMQQFLMLETNPCDVIKLFPDLLPSSSSGMQPQQMKLTDKELESGLLALIDYLSEIHGKLINSKPQKSALLSIVDTTLLKCYLQTNDAMVAPLLRLNMVHYNETEQVLKKYDKISELVILYQTNGQTAQALALLKKQKNIEKTVQYLKHLGPEHLNLIMEYSTWVLEENPQEGLKIFIEDTNETEQLPRPQVVNFLLRTAKDMAIPYLEHVIKVWKDTNPILHTTLANLYREKYQSLQEVAENRQEALKLREKLLAFLEQSAYYTPHTVMSLFPKDGMLEERAILLGRLGRHEQALSIYVCHLEDVERAKQYCEKVYANKMTGYDEVFVLLMRILISPPENWLVGLTEKPPKTQKDLPTALEVLRTYSDKIEPAQALSVLPDHVPLKEIRSFLVTSIRNKLQARRGTQILKALVDAEYYQVQDQRMKCESRSILVTELHICVICSKRFTNQSVVALIPAGMIHIGCQGDAKQ